MIKTRDILEFGDFQTPLDLAKEVAIVAVNSLANNSLANIKTIIEPTCGLGTFIKALIEIENEIETEVETKIKTEIGTEVKNIIGWEINPKYVEIAQHYLCINHKAISVSVKEQDFFQVDWSEVNSQMQHPVLFIGNPPWVTNSELGKLLSKNLPKKSNFQKFSGLEAITGKSNFDISEWILIKICEQISNTDSALAFLVKTSVARKVYQYISQNNLLISSIFIREIDAQKYFNVTVDACLFFAKGTKSITIEYLCPVYSNLKISTPYKTIGISKGKLISDINTYKNLSYIDYGCEFKWRSGVKHDASKIMEFRVTDQGLINGLGEIVKLPNDYLYPMYKSSDIAQEILKNPKRMMLVTQINIGDDTTNIRKLSPKTWEYLIIHSERLDARKSSIYKHAPRFSVFGVGNYTFKPWKIAVSSLYKNIKFTKIGIFQNKPIVLDDTCYMLGFDLEEEADLVLEILKSDIAGSFINSLIFKDNKRAITVNILNRINLRSIALRVGINAEFENFFIHNATE